MGTRNLVAVYAGGDYRIAQYGQWDGYPDGEGLTVLRFLHKMNRDEFTEKVLATRWISDHEIENLWVECGAERGSDLVPMAVSNRFAQEHPELSRDTGGAILDIVNERKPGIKLSNSIKFASNSLFCEWAYVVDLDKGTFEVYKGFNKRKLGKKQRFYWLEAKQGEKKTPTSREYHPVRRVAVWPLGALPTNEEFLSKFKRD